MTVELKRNELGLCRGELGLNHTCMFRVDLRFRWEFHNYIAVSALWLFVIHRPRIIKVQFRLTMPRPHLQTPQHVQPTSTPRRQVHSPR